MVKLFGFENSDIDLSKVNVFIVNEGRLSVLLTILLYFLALRDDREIISAEEATRVSAYVEKVRGIREVLRRDHMKVAFFGR